MPIMKRRHEHTKVYRPNGTRFANGKDYYLERALDKAWQNFENEFGSLPKQEHVVLEVLGVTAAWDVTLMEIMEILPIHWHGGK